MTIRKNVPLKDYSNYKIGGPASYFCQVSSKDELKDLLSNWHENLPIFILGKGTNILISEQGYKGLVIHNNINGIRKVGEKVEISSGTLVSDFLNFCIENNLSGFEWAGGLPGSIGGALRGNAGAFKGETKDSVFEVKSLNIKTLEETRRDRNECKFSYRSSIFKTEKTDEIILSITFNLQKGDKNLIRKLIQEKIDYRNQKHPMDFPSIGSTFKNIPLEDLTSVQRENLLQFVKDDPFPVIPVAKLLFLCDLKGKRVGDAQISTKHPNFIVNLGNANSKDVIELIKFAKGAVWEKFGIGLEEEIMYLGLFD